LARALRECLVNSGSTTQVLQVCLDRLRQGDLAARDELITYACNRLVILTRKMLGQYSRLHNWEQTDDVAQNALMRLRRSLEVVQPATVREFIGLASVQIRRELADLTRHYYGREQGSAAKREGKAASPRMAPPRGQAAAAEGELQSPDAPADATLDPVQLNAWSEFHAVVQKLPEQEREVVELLWYQDLSQEEAAELLSVDKSTVKRRWRSARTKLAESLKGWLP
jgi:RNA polymerase sigma factor (sigma-70 family)